MKKQDDFKKIWDSIPKDVQDELTKALEESSATSVEEFISEIFVGDCPECGSRNTRDCEELPDIDDITIGLCNDCGRLWCTECGRTITKGDVCEHWEICEKCTRKKDEFGDCGIPPWECAEISVFDDGEDEDAL